MRNKLALFILTSTKKDYIRLAAAVFVGIIYQAIIMSIISHELWGTPLF